MENNIHVDLFLGLVFVQGVHSYNFFVYLFMILKVHKCRFENFTLCLGSYKNNTLKISHS